MWELKELGLDANIRWEIAQRAAPYKCGSRRCDLCITEKTIIALADPKSLLISTNVQSSYHAAGIGESTAALKHK